MKIVRENIYSVLFLKFKVSLLGSSNFLLIFWNLDESNHIHNGNWSLLKFKQGNRKDANIRYQFCVDVIDYSKLITKAAKNIPNTER